MKPEQLPQYIIDVKEHTEQFTCAILDKIKAHISSNAQELVTPPAETAAEETQAESEPDDAELINEDGSIEFVITSPDELEDKQDSKPANTLIQEISDEYPQKLPELKESLKASISRDFFSLLESSPENKGDDDSNGLSLVQDDELELQIILTHAESTLLDTSQLELALLTIRLEEFTKCELKVTEIPAGPIAIGEAFEKAVLQLDLTQDQKKMILIAILVELKLRFPDYLRQANNLMMSAGILPVLSPNDERVKNKINATRLLVEERKKDLEDLDEDGVMVSGDIADLVRNLQLPEKYQQHGVKLDENLETITPEEFRSKLNALVQAPVKQDNNVYYEYDENEKSLAEQVVNQAELEQFGINSANCNTVSILSMLFEQLLSNPHIPNPIKALLSQLKVPLLKAATSSEDFFDENEHSARSLFNEIAETGLSWMPEENPENDELYKTMASAVEKLASDDANDELFQDSLEEIQSFKEQHEKKSHKFEERIVQKESSQARLTRARELSETHVQNKFTAPEIPDELKSFFNSTWKQVLFFIYNKEGDENGEEWLDAIETENTIIANLHEAEEDDIDICIDILHEKLADNGIDAKQVDKICDEVKSILLNSNLKEEETGLSEKLAQHDEATSKTKQEQRDERLERLQVGTWLMKMTGETTIKIKMAARIKFNDTYVMVHRNGQKENIYTSAELIELLDSAKLFILDSGSIKFDTALESVIEEIRA